MHRGEFDCSKQNDANEVALGVWAIHGRLSWAMHTWGCARIVFTINYQTESDQRIMRSRNFCVINEL